MRQLKVACTEKAGKYVVTSRECVLPELTDFTDVAALVVTDADIDAIEKANNTKFGIPIIKIPEQRGYVTKEFNGRVRDHYNLDRLKPAEISNIVERSARDYENKLLPPFVKTLTEYVESNNFQFDCPGHQGGEYLRRHPAGRYLFDFFGENIFRSDICNADVELGDLLIHEGPAAEAERYAAKVYNSDKTYFIMNGTSTANTVSINAVVAPGNLVLFDRNNHKSIYNAALVQSGGNAVYLETSRNPFGFIGGIDAHCFNEEYLRGLVMKEDPQKAKCRRPFRLAVIQLGTYDGTIYNARQVVDKIGHLCDYILFDSAWVGYEQFIPMMKDCSPLLLELNANDPGILVTQSVHKQQSGFSQSSQIHKKDGHIKGQKRYVENKRFNNAYRLHASTSPFYPIFAILALNARMQDGEAGKRLWMDCVLTGIEARKRVLEKCSLFKPFIPPTVNGRKWSDYSTEEIASDIEFFRFRPGERWHAFEEYGENQYFVDPNKFMLTTPGIDVETGAYEEFGIPAAILANYLRENRIIPEKSDLNSILFLMTPAVSREKMEVLITTLAEFEEHIKRDSDLPDVLPKLYANNKARYRGYTIRRLCQEMHDFYRKNEVNTYQRKLFRSEYFPERAMSPCEANWELVRNHAKLVKLEEIVGGIALEGALPYPPGIYCVVPGERWNETAQKYFLILEEGVNRFPGFAPEIQGVYLKKTGDEMKAYGYVLDK